MEVSSLSPEFQSNPELNPSLRVRPSLPPISRNVASAEKPVEVDLLLPLVLFSELLTKVPSRKVSELLAVWVTSLLKRKEGRTWNHTFPASFWNSILALKVSQYCLPASVVLEARFPSSWKVVLSDWLPESVSEYL